jgi:hypothetical protein
MRETIQLTGMIVFIIIVKCGGRLMCADDGPRGHHFAGAHVETHALPEPL